MSNGTNGPEVCGITSKPVEGPKLTRKDFVPEQEVRWCPGCGDYVVLAQIQKVLPSLGIPREKFVFVSGIGCSSRFPYYMNTYGFHTIHGRAPAIATGLKMARPDLSVWVITGDGDALAIGGNHFIHAMRRNIGLKIILFNNRIYGLTKGQYSPTSERGKKAKSTPYGSIDAPFNPAALALGAGASFVARTTDADPNHMASIFEQAGRHEGTAFIEVLQNCVVFNDGSWDFVNDKTVRDERTIRVEHGKPLLFGHGKKAIRFVDGRPQAVTDLEKGTHTWDAQGEVTLAFAMAQCAPPELPMALGVLRAAHVPSYEQLDAAQETQVRKNLGQGTLQKLLYSDDTWKVG